MLPPMRPRPFPSPIPSLSPHRPPAHPHRPTLSRSPCPNPVRRRPPARPPRLRPFPRPSPHQPAEGDLACAVRPPARENGGNEEVTAIDVSRIQEVVQLIEAGDLTQAANRLGPMVSGKRSIRGGRSTPEAEEIDEVKKWLGEVVADPDDPGARFLVERSYYKLRSQLPKDEAQHRVAKK